MSKQYWRLLEPEVDVWQERDECLTEKGWRAILMGAVGAICHSYEAQGRRRITLPEPQGWVSVKERMPTKEDASKEGLIIWGWSDNSCLPLDWRTGIHQEPKWWRPFKFEPVPVTNPDEEAWGEWWKETGSKYGHQSAMEVAFMAGRKSVTTEKEGEV